MSKIEFNGVSSAAATITDDHFGLNFVADYERIGDRGWETFDEIVENAGAQHLRYPGGVFAEAFMDIRNPNATHVELANGHMQQVMPLHDFLKYAKDADKDVAVIIPMTQPLSNDSYGNRTFDEDWYGPIFKFVYSTLAANGGDTVSVFELGNEYEGYMTSQEYGRVASRIAKITQNAINKFKEDRDLDNSWDEPEIAVQTWSLNVQNSLTLDEQNTRNQAVMAQFSADEIAAVDRIVSHFYYEEGRFAGQSNEQTLANMDNAVFASVNILQNWEREFGKSFVLDYSEWNVTHFAGNVTGMAQLPIVISMFESFTELGVDAMSFWSAMYHATSMGLNNGELTAVGELMRVMQEKLVGYRAIDTNEDIQNAEVSAFINGDSVVMFLSSTQAGNNTFTLDPNTSFKGYEIIGAQTIKTDLSSADGAFRNLTGLASYLEPDLPGYITDFALPKDFAANGGTLTLSAHQTVIFELVKISQSKPIVTVATDQNDVLTYIASTSNFNGLDGFDLVSGESSGSAVVLDLMNDIGGNGDVRFLNVEGLSGSNQNDVLRGDHNANWIYGGDGNSNDQLVGRDGADTIKGGAGDDLIYGGNDNDILHGDAGNDLVFAGEGDDMIIGGAGDDAIHAGEGNDHILYAGGLDMVDGEAGIDLLDLSGSAASVSIGAIDHSERPPDVMVEFANIENFVFGAGSDAFYSGSVSNANVQLGAGNDFAQDKGNGNSIFGGLGDDEIVAKNGSVNAIGGEGDDFIQLGGGKDIFVFKADGGHDSVKFFDQDNDVLAMEGFAIDMIENGDYALARYSFGMKLILDDNQGSIDFKGLSENDVNGLLDNIVDVNSLDFL